MHVIDTNMLIVIARGSKKAKPVIDALAGESIFTTTISQYEFMRGIPDWENPVPFLNQYALLDFDQKSAFQSSRIFRKLKHEGISISALDVLIAGTCQANRATLHTLDKDFQKIPDFSVVVYP